MTVLVTGFDPFGGESVNPAYEAVRRLPNHWMTPTAESISIHLIKCELPTVFGDSIRVLIETISREAPDVIICVGQAGGRFGITPERVAINMDDARIPDNSGRQPIDIPIEPEGPPAYFSTLPIKAITQALVTNGIPASVSNSAGTYVCNHIFYGLMHSLNTRFKHNGCRGGFIHVPYIESQAASKPGTPSMCLDSLVKGLTIAIETTCVHAQKGSADLLETGGSIC